MNFVFSYITVDIVQIEYRIVFRPPVNSFEFKQHGKSYSFICSTGKKQTNKKTKHIRNVFVKTIKNKNKKKTKTKKKKKLRPKLYACPYKHGKVHTM